MIKNLDCKLWTNVEGENKEKMCGGAGEGEEEKEEQEVKI